MPGDDSNGSAPIQTARGPTPAPGNEADRRLHPSIDEDRARALSPIVAGLMATVADAVPKLPFDVDVSQYYTLLERFADVDD